MRVLGAVCRSGSSGRVVLGWGVVEDLTTCGQAAGFGGSGKPFPGVVGCSSVRLGGGGCGPAGGVVVEAEGGEACEVDGGGAGGEVGQDARDAPASGFASAVGSSGEVADLAFDFRTGGPVGGLPLRVGLIGLGLLHAGLVLGDGDRAAGGRGRASFAERASAAQITERRDAAAISAMHDWCVEVGRAPHDIRVEIDIEGVLGEQPVSVRGRRHLGGHTETLVVEAFAKLGTGIGGVTHHFRLHVQVCARCEEILGCVLVGRIGGGDGDIVDDLGVRIDRHVALVAIEAAAAALVPVAG